jgi:intraflagellar transport protein 56
MANDDHFNYNFAQVQVALGDFVAAEEALVAIQGDRLQNEYTYISHLTRCCKFYDEYYI